jgi:hypothetical protein
MKEVNKEGMVVHICNHKMLRHGDEEFEASQSYKARTCVQK